MFSAQTVVIALSRIISEFYQIEERQREKERANPFSLTVTAFHYKNNFLLH